MNSRYIKKIISVLSCALIAAVFIIALYFGAPEIESVKETTGEFNYFGKITKPDGTYEWGNRTLEFGKDFAAVRITDLGDLGKLTKVNYIADKFVQPNSLGQEYEIVDLTKPFEFAEKGTLMFAVMNLDPWSENFDKQSEAMSKYKMGENWCFTVKIPKIFSASNIYYNTQLVARNGEIENYDFKEFNTNYVNKTENFSAQTEPTYIELRFYTKREAISNGFITIHYQSTKAAYSGITDCPIIGTESAVKNIAKTSQNLVLACAILAAAVLAVLAVLSFVEQSGRFISAIVWILGITVMLLSRYFISGVTEAPLFWSGIALSMPFIILGGAQFAIGRNFGKIPAKIIFPSLSAVGAVLAFICPFIPYGAANAVKIVCLVIKAVGALSLTVFIGFAVFEKGDRHGILETVCATLIDVAVTASLFLPQIFPAQINPMFWMCAATILTTFLTVVIVITDMKKSNVYLTSNLQSEVERQVKDIKAVISERDSLLQFVSHDMKKPLSSAVLLCNAAIERERDDEQIKTINIIKQDAERVINNLSEIAAYAKLNYLAEPSEVVDMSELCALLYKFHHFDCDANGIILKVAADKPVKAFVKPKGIENVVSNIIINAIEHANCSAITLSVKTDKNKVILCVADDGKGIDESLDVFRPYISENDTETGGLGLYICKNIIESMNGTLTYETGQNGTTFFISLLKA